jgi:hypothetical protein
VPSRRAAPLAEELDATPRVPLGARDRLEALDRDGEVLGGVGERRRDPLGWDAVEDLIDEAAEGEGDHPGRAGAGVAEGAPDVGVALVLDQVGIDVVAEVAAGVAGDEGAVDAGAEAEDDRGDDHEVAEAAAEGSSVGEAAVHQTPHAWQTENATIARPVTRAARWVARAGAGTVTIPS